MSPQRFRQMAVKVTHEQPLPMPPAVPKHNPMVQMKKVSGTEYMCH